MKKFLFVLTGFLLGVSLSASHIVGGQIQVICVDDSATSGLEYKAYLMLLREPAGAGLAATTTLTLHEGSQYTSVTGVRTQRYNVHLRLRSIEVNIYEVNLLLQSNTHYKIDWNLCCRAPGIMNFGSGNSSSYSMYYDAEFVTGVSCNSAPLFLAPPSYQIPVNMPWVMSGAAFDLDGDSLYYSLDVPKQIVQNSGVPISGYTAPPSALGGELRIDSLTGVLSYTGNTIGRYSFAYKVQAYANGILTGVVRRDYDLEVRSGPSSQITVTKPPFSSVNGYLFRVNSTDTVSIQAMISRPISAECHFPSYVDTSKVFFSSTPLSSTPGVTANFSYSPSLGEEGFSFPVVIRFNTDYMAWDEVFRVEVTSASTVSVKNIENPHIAIFPNPTEGSFAIEFDKPMSSLCIYDGVGRLVLTSDLSDVSGKWSSATPLSPGVYFIHLINAEGAQWTESLIVR